MRAKPGFANHPSNEINSVAVAPDGTTIAFGQWSRDVTLLDLPTGSLVNVLSGHEREGIFSLLYSRDGKHLVSAGADPEIRVWEVVARFACRGRDDRPAGRIVALACTSDGTTIVSGSREDRLSRWHSPSGVLQGSWTAGHGGIHSLALSADGQTLFSAGRDGMVRAWNVQTGQRQAVCALTPVACEAWR